MYSWILGLYFWDFDMDAVPTRKRILFINPPQTMTEQIYTRRVAKQYSESAYVLPNTSIAYLAAYLEKLGFEVRILDAFALGSSIEEAAAEIKRFDPIAVCFNLYTQNFLNHLGWIKGIKERTGLPTVVGGLQMSIYPEEVLSHEAIDFGVIGEGWQPCRNCLKTSPPAAIRPLCGVSVTTPKAPIGPRRPVLNPVFHWRTCPFPPAICFPTSVTPR